MSVKKVDNNQKELVKQIRKIPGVTVQHTHMIGQGFVDVVVGFRKQTYLFEIKNPALSPSKRKLTQDEEVFHKNWTGHIAIVETINDVLKELKLTA